ncbi:MAG: bZIP transcription factor [Saprospirales bacterium]|nr:bZIP transcription factor [Saprospirales bacterium]
MDMELSLEDDGTLFWRGGADDTGSGLNNLMMLTGTGKLAIGTTSTPTSLGASDLTPYTLFAAGGILTEEVRVRTGWADHVFAHDYPLQGLNEVANYIEENCKLPDMPSTEEVEANGLEIGEITVKQQEKIEELFLHMIEMDKELKALKQENEALKARLEQLEK